MPLKIQRILIAVKPWSGRLPISVARASALAKGLGAEIGLTSSVRLSALEEGLAWADPTLGLNGTSAIPNRNRHELAELERLAESLRTAGITVTTDVRSNDRPELGILDEVSDWKADLLIVGVHEPASLASEFLTDVDKHLMRLCPCPLWIADAPKDEPYRTIHAAVDPLHEHAEPSGLDHAILDVADHLRRALGARLSVVSAIPDPDRYEVASSIEPEPGVFYGTENMVAAHRQAVADLLDECSVADTDIHVRIGKPADVICEVARDASADLIVLGSIKRSRLADAILGSTAERVAGEALCDIVLIRPPNR